VPRIRRDTVLLIDLKLCSIVIITIARNASPNLNFDLVLIDNEWVIEINMSKLMKFHVQNRKFLVEAFAIATEYVSKRRQVYIHNEFDCTLQRKIFCFSIYIMNVNFESLWIFHCQVIWYESVCHLFHPYYFISLWNDFIK